MPIVPRRFPTTCGLLAAFALGCSGGDRAAPADPVMALAKADTLSGDQQVGIAGRELAAPLRVVVTRDGIPAPGVPVYWRTSEWELTPVRATTDRDGIASTRWRLLLLFAQQGAIASLDSMGPPGVIFTAVATPDPGARNTILVGGNGNQFQPADLTIPAGQTVNWFWPPGSANHNVVPDDNDSPPGSGAPAGYPTYLSYQFTVPGVYHYYCQVHGGPGGAGMAGTITVTGSCGTSCNQ
jgi:plastocyanin